MTFYRKDFINDNKKHIFMVKKNQLEGLTVSSKFNGIISGLVLNFRKSNHTYFLSIIDANIMLENIDRKSFNEKDVIANNGYLIEQRLKKVKYNYNLQRFIEDMQLKQSKLNNKGVN